MLTAKQEAHLRRWPIFIGIIIYTLWYLIGLVFKPVPIFSFSPDILPPGTTSPIAIYHWHIDPLISALALRLILWVHFKKDWPALTLVVGLITVFSGGLLLYSGFPDLVYNYLVSFFAILVEHIYPRIWIPVILLLIYLAGPGLRRWLHANDQERSVGA